MIYNIIDNTIYKKMCWCVVLLIFAMCYDFIIQKFVILQPGLLKVGAAFAGCPPEKNKLRQIVMF